MRQPGIQGYTLFGMKQDSLVDGTETSSYAYEIKNLRLSQDGDETTLSWCTEKSTKRIFPIYDNLSKVESIYHFIQSNNTDFFDICPIGQCVIDDVMVMFFKTNYDQYNSNHDKYSESCMDMIIKYWFEGNEFKGHILYVGNLNLNYEHPLETIGWYESENIQKVYWVDGINQPRMINLGRGDFYLGIDSNTCFDFCQEVDLKEHVEIIKHKDGAGVFPAGTVKYFITYYTQYGSESNIVWESPLYYPSRNDRGVKEDNTELSGDSFEIKIYNIDKHKNFDYLRLYSIVRAKDGGSAVVSIVEDVQLKGNRNYSIVINDTNQGNQIVDPNILPYIGGKDYSAETFDTMKNVLFFGNIHSREKSFTSQIKNQFNLFDNDMSSPLFCVKADFAQSTDYIMQINTMNQAGVYKYINQLDQYDNGVRLLNGNSFNIKNFKQHEWYRFGIQFQDIHGRWSEVLPIKHKVNNGVVSNDFDIENLMSLNVSSDGGYVHKTFFEYKMDIDNSFWKNVIEGKYKKARLCRAKITPMDRTWVYQGVLNPTVYNKHWRENHVPDIMSSWFFRPDTIDDSRFNVRSKEHNGELSHIKASVEYYSNNDNSWDTGDNTINSINNPFAGHGSNFQNYDNSAATTNYSVIQYAKDGNNDGVGVINADQVFQTVYTRYNGTYEDYFEEFNTEIQTMDCMDYGDGREKFCVDRCNLTFNSPELELDTTQESLDLEHVDYKVIGLIPISGFMSSFDIYATSKTSPKTTSGTLSPSAKGYIELPSDSDLTNIPPYNPSIKKTMSVRTGYWDDYHVYNGIEEGNQGKVTGYPKRAIYPLYPFQRKGSLCNFMKELTPEQSHNSDWAVNRSSILDYKVLSNLRYSFKNKYFGSALDLDYHKFNIFDSTEVDQIYVKTNDSGDTLVYHGNMDSIAPQNQHIMQYVFNDQKLKSIPFFEGAYFLPGCIESDYIENFWDENRQGKFYGLLGVSSDPVPITYKSTRHAVIHNSTPLKYLNTSSIINNDYNQTTHEYSYRQFKYSIGIVNPDETITWRNLTQQTFKSYDDRFFLNRFNNITVGIEEVNLVDSFHDATPLDDPDWITATIVIDNVEYLVRFFAYTEKTVGTSITESRETLEVDDDTPCLQLCDVYRQSVTNRYGGHADEDYLNYNQWFPCGEAVLLHEGINTLHGLEGDTYYMRYDCLKTYPFRRTDTNQIVEILSFMVESRINLDGRYDSRRGMRDNTTVDDTNYNFINKGYTQDNNSIIQTTLDEWNADVTKYESSITYTDPKINGEKIDPWATIDISVLKPIEGNHGKITKLKTYKQYMYTFQEHAISAFAFDMSALLENKNSLMPLKIGKANGMSEIQYITREIGCQNKWSISPSEQMISFIDDDAKRFYAFTSKQDGLTPASMSTAFGMDTWFKINLKSDKPWNPYEMNNFVAQYDMVANEGYLTDKNYSIAQNYLISDKSFTGFYDYNNTPYITSLNGHTIAYHNEDGELSNNKGFYLLRPEFDANDNNRYGWYFDKQKPYWLTICCNGRFGENNFFNNDKVFDTIEYVANVSNEKIGNDLLGASYDVRENPFDVISAWNDYQIYSEKPIEGRKKFDTWRANIPRATYVIAEANRTPRDRVRGHYALIKLKKSSPSKRMRLHNILVKYSIK